MIYELTFVELFIRRTTNSSNWIDWKYRFQSRSHLFRPNRNLDRFRCISTLDREPELVLPLRDLDCFPKNNRLLFAIFLLGVSVMLLRVLHFAIGLDENFVNVSSSSDVKFEMEEILSA